MKKLLLTSLLSLAAIALFTANASAIEIVAKENVKLDIYGEIYGDFFYSNATGSFLEQDSYLDSRSDPLFVKPDESGHAFGSMALMGSSLLGFDLNFGKAQAIFELGIGDPVRKAILKYNFNSDDEHYLLIGKQKILSYYNFGQVSNDWQSLIGFGTLSDYRRVTLRYGIKGFHLGIVMPYASDWYQDPFYDVVDVLNEELGGEVFNSFKAIPGVEIAYTFANDIVDLKAFASYRPYYGTYGKDEDIKDILFHAANVGFGSDFFVGDGIIHFTAWYGLNQNLTGGLSQVYANSFIINDEDKIIGTNQHQAFGVALGFEYTIAGFVTPGIGVGYTGAFASTSTKLRNYIGAYINCKFDIGKYFSLIPEVAFQTVISPIKDSDGNNYENGNLITAGLLAQVIF